MVSTQRSTVLSRPFNKTSLVTRSEPDLGRKYLPATNTLAYFAIESKELPTKNSGKYFSPIPIFESKAGVYMSGVAYVYVCLIGNSRLG